VRLLVWRLPDSRLPLGSISTYLSARGVLEPQQQLTLTSCAKELDAVLSHLTANDAGYVNRLIKIAGLIDP
jgi:hypothetical protein